MTQVSTQKLKPNVTWPPEPLRWPTEFPPACARCWGDDRYGIWIEIAIGWVAQRFRWIEPGEFVMGSSSDEEGHQDNEGPQHLVRLTRGFWLAETACSQAVWEIVMASNPSKFRNDPLQPVDQVSWDDVQSFLHKVQKWVPGVSAGLPTEAEWEYACRAGSETAFSWGGGITPSQANYRSTESYGGGPTGQYREKTVVVKSFSPNDWGLYQMHGNVWEWCADSMRPYHEAAQIDPLGAESNISRVVRGGSWIQKPHKLRAAYRALRPRDIRRDSPGFRLCLRIWDHAASLGNSGSKELLNGALG